LQGLKDVKKRGSGVCRHEIAVAGYSMIDFVGADDGGDGCSEVWQDSSESNVVCLTRDFAQVECFSDGVLGVLMRKPMLWSASASSPDLT
jgi:hypothetical protein